MSDPLDLKPCPFCGERAALVADNGPYLVECVECRAAGPRAPYPKKAAEFWNRRSTPVITVHASADLKPETVKALAAAGEAVVKAIREGKIKAPTPQAATPDPRPMPSEDLLRYMRKIPKAGAEAQAPSVREAVALLDILDRKSFSNVDLCRYCGYEFHQETCPIERLRKILEAQPGKEDKEGEDGKQG